MRQEKMVVIDGVEYTVRESSMELIMPILEKGSEMKITDLAKISVFRSFGDEPLGDAVLCFGLRDFQKLQQAVAEVHGLLEESPGNVS